MWEGESHYGDVAFIWDGTYGIRNLRDVLSELLSPAGKAALDGWMLNHAAAISADGRTIVGWGTNPNGQREAWLAYLGTEVPEPASWMLLCVGVIVVLAARARHVSFNLVWRAA